MKHSKINPVPWGAWLDKQHTLLWGCCVEGTNTIPASSWFCRGLNVCNKVYSYTISLFPCVIHIHCLCCQLPTASFITHNTGSDLHRAALHFKSIILLLCRTNSFMCTATQADHHIALKTCLLQYLLN